VEGCLACDLAEGRRPLPGGRILSEGGWIVEHCVGPLGVGTLVVKPERHVLRVSELSDGEAEALGPLLQRVAATVDQLMDADQVYVSLWSHANRDPVHIHFVVQPITHATMEAHGAHGPELQAAMFEHDELPPESEVAEFAGHARELLEAA
jgi:diadenosine tetraphosphate (Ap4A) HIT family hydrolase